MNHKPDNINKFLNVFRSPLKILGLVSIVLLLAGIVTAWTYTNPPRADCFYNGTCVFGNTKWNETSYTAESFYATANVTAGYYNTTDGRELQNGDCDSSYCVGYNLTDGTTIEAVNGSNGKVQYRNSDAGTVILNSAVANSHIYIKRGTYSVSQLNITANNVKIECQDKYTTTIKLKDSQNQWVLNFTGDNATLQNCGIDGNKANQVFSARADHIAVRFGSTAAKVDNPSAINNYIHDNMAGAGLSVYGKNITIKENLLKDNGYSNDGQSDGIYTQAIGGTITGNTAINFTDTGIAHDYSERVTISNNIVLGGVASDIGIAGLGTDNSSIIEGNNVDTTPSGAGIYVYTDATSGNAANLSISKNTVKALTYGIRIIGNATYGNMTDVTISDNIAHAQNLEVYQLKNISGLTLSNNRASAAAVKRAYDLTGIEDYVINGNSATKDSFEHGILCTDCLNGTITGNQLQNSVFNGIGLIRANNTIVSGNAIFNASFGVRFNPANQSEAYSNVFVDVTTPNGGNAINSNSVMVRFNFTDNTMNCLVAATNRFCGNGTAI